MKFSSLPLSQPILDAVAKKGYEYPSPIQEKAIPPILDGHDVMAAAQTGTGKTAGFTLPILEKLNLGSINGTQVKSNHVRALVITPTRELAAQVEESVKTYGASLPLSSTVVFGGVKINPQMMRLRKGVDILVATPGRLLDLFQQNAIKFNQLEVLVLDEADRMLDMGFIHDIKKILKLLPAKRQNLLFSATFSDDIRSLAKGIVKNPVEILVTPPNSTANTVKQILHPVDKSKKPQLLASLIKNNDWEQVLVFTRTKHGANRLTRFLEEKGITAAAIHGNKSQGARTKALAGFKALKLRVLVATDIAARGLDISQLPHVVNFDLPNVPEDYVHRIGRTGRAGASGEAVSLVAADEIKQLTDIERLIQKHVPREYVDGFEPNHEVPESSPLKSTQLPKKPKKPKKKHGEVSKAQERGNSSEKTTSKHRSKTNNAVKAKGSFKKKGSGAKDERNGKALPQKRRKPRAGSKTAASRRTQQNKDR